MIKYNRKTWGHNVLDLFDEVSNEEQKGFEYLWQHYALGQWRESEEHSPGELTITIAFAGVEHVYQREPWAISMKSTLERTRDRFKDWRYLFEKGDKLSGSGEILHFIHEYNSINAMNMMIDKSIEDEIDRRA